MGSKEEIIEVAQNGEGEIPQAVQECLKFTQKVTYLSMETHKLFPYVICDGDTCFPNLVAPVNVQNPAITTNFIFFSDHLLNYLYMLKMPVGFSSSWAANEVFSMPSILLIASKSYVSLYFVRTFFFTNLSQ